MVKRVIVEKRLWIVPLLIALGANAIAYGVGVYPLSVAVAGGEQRAQNALTALRAAEREHQAAASAVSGTARARQELQKFYAEVLPANLSAAGRTMYLELAQLARECRVKYERRMLDTDTLRDSSLASLKMTMVLEGSYEDIRRFIYRIETASEFVIIDNVALGQGRSPDGPLALTLQVSTFFRAGDHGS